MLFLFPQKFFLGRTGEVFFFFLCQFQQKICLSANLIPFHCISRERKSSFCVSVLAGSPELVLPERRCSAAAPLVVSGHRPAFRCSPDAAGAPLYTPGLPRAAQGLVPLDGGLGLPATQKHTKVEMGTWTRKLLIRFKFARQNQGTYSNHGTKRFPSSRFDCLHSLTSTPAVSTPSQKGVETTCAWFILGCVNKYKYYSEGTLFICGKTTKCPEDPT